MSKTHDRSSRFGASAGTPTWRPGRLYRLARRSCQTVTLLAIFAAPLLGGWQRLDRAEMAAFNHGGWDLADPLQRALPLGDWPVHAYDALVLHGGGVGAQYFAVPAVDPIAAAWALASGAVSLLLALTAGIPLVLALLAGRVFCGWFCPFGTLARGLGSLHDRLRLPRFRLPKARPLRWLLLAGIAIACASGVDIALYAALPHAMFQQSVYALWLLGGIGAAFGVLLGLVIAGLCFGPTLYCAALCPTGTALGALGAARRVSLTIANPQRCGTRCQLCTNVCWLQLDPASGNPGRNCDLCARCTAACPQQNLCIAPVGSGRRTLAIISKAGVKTGAAILVFATALPADAAPARPARDRAEQKPEVVMHQEKRVGTAWVGVAATDYRNVRLGIDSAQQRHDTQVTVTIAQGLPPAAGKRGYIASRLVYRGKITVTIARDDNVLLRQALTSPNAPRSAPRPTVYRVHIRQKLHAGDRVTVHTTDSSWLSTPTSFVVPPRGNARTPTHVALIALAAFAVFGGLMMLSLVVSTSRS